MALKPIPLTADPDNPESPKGAVPVDLFGVESGGGGGAVDSVNGQTGEVVLGAGDVGARPAGDVPWGEVSDKPATYPPAPHTHAIGEVTGLQSALDGKQPEGDYLTEGDLPDLSGYVETSDPRLTDARTPLAHTHPISDVTGLQDALDNVEGGVPSEITVEADESLTQVTIMGDDTPTASWPDRVQWRYHPDGGSPRLVQWTNEYGEQRLIPANNNTVGWRLFARDAANEPVHSGDVWQICDNRTNRNVIASVDEGGFRAKNLPNSMLVSDTPPSNPEPGDVWIDTSGGD